MGAGVYLELLFKQLNADVWIANLQLQLFCVPIAVGALATDWDALVENGPVHGWDRITCIVVLLNALGGFAVSLTMKYADNILKTFAVSMSLVLNCVLSSVLFAVRLTLQDIIGIVFVISSSWIYNKAGKFANSETKSVDSPSPHSTHKYPKNGGPKPDAIGRNISESSYELDEGNGSELEELAR